MKCIKMKNTRAKLLFELVKYANFLTFVDVVVMLVSAF